MFAVWFLLFRLYNIHVLAHTAPPRQQQQMSPPPTTLHNCHATRCSAVPHYGNQRPCRHHHAAFSTALHTDPDAGSRHRATCGSHSHMYTKHYNNIHQLHLQAQEPPLRFRRKLFGKFEAPQNKTTPPIFQDNILLDHRTGSKQETGDSPALLTPTEHCNYSEVDRIQTNMEVVAVQPLA